MFYIHRLCTGALFNPFQATVHLLLPRQVLANGVLLVDKPPRWSSTDIIRQLKQLLKVKKIGVGGPLDAQASGLVIVLLGKLQEGSQCLDVHLCESTLQQKNCQQTTTAAAC